MNLPTATLTIILGIMASCTPLLAPALTFEQRWEPVKLLPPMVDRSPQHPVHTFEERWEPVRKMPRMLLPETQDIGPRVVPVRTIAVRPEPAVMPAVHVEQVNVASADRGPVPMPREHPKARTIRKASLDICQRHNMRKVHYGRTWRCRK